MKYKDYQTINSYRLFGIIQQAEVSFPLVVLTKLECLKINKLLICIKHTNLSTGNYH